VVLGAALLCATVYASHAATPERGAAVATEIRALIASNHHPDLVWPEFPWYQDELEGLYHPTGDQPFWMDADGHLKPEGKDVVTVLETASSRGLPLDEYNVDWLKSRLAALEGKASFSPIEIARLDGALSLLLMRYISDLHIGRINPHTLNYGIDVAPKKYVLQDLVRELVSRHALVAGVPQTVEPNTPQYRALLEQLPRYRDLATRTDLGLPRAGAKLKLGGHSSLLPVVRRLLVALGDFDTLPPESGTIDSSFYGGAIVEAMKHFQNRHGLDPDGVVGPGTWKALQVPLAHRLRQIELSLERMRWLPEPRAGRPFVVVNVPGFTLWAFDSLTVAPALSMNVIVGKSLDKQTPIFLEEMRYVVFRPYWNVPYKIASTEILPKLRENPGYLDKEDMELIASKGGTVVPLDAAAMAGIESGAIRIRQRPGKKNSLGSAKFIFPNDQNVYLHGTPSHGLFARARRDFSHGCVRVEDPAALAAFVLKDQPEWTAAKIEAAMNGTSESRATLTAPLTVLIFYATAVVDPSGQMDFFEDIYGQDEALDRALRAGEPYLP